MGFGWCSVDLVRQQNVAKDRPFNKTKSSFSIRPLLNDVGSRDVGWHEIRCELDAVELQVQDISQRMDQQGLGQSRNTHKESVAPSKEGNQQMFHHSLLPDHTQSQLGFDGLASLMELLSEGLVVGGGVGSGICSHDGHWVLLMRLGEWDRCTLPRSRFSRQSAVPIQRS